MHLPYQPRNNLSIHIHQSYEFERDSPATVFVTHHHELKDTFNSLPTCMPVDGYKVLSITLTRQDKENGIQAVMVTTDHRTISITHAHAITIQHEIEQYIKMMFIDLLSFMQNHQVVAFDHINISEKENAYTAKDYHFPDSTIVSLHNIVRNVEMAERTELCISYAGDEVINPDLPQFSIINGQWMSSAIHH